MRRSAFAVGIAMWSILTVGICILLLAPARVTVVALHTPATSYHVCHCLAILHCWQPSEGCYDLAEPKTIDYTGVGCQGKIVWRTTDQQGFLHLIGRTLRCRQYLGYSVHCTGLGATDIFGPLRFHQHDMPSTGPEKIDLAVLLVAIKKERRPRVIEPLVFPQFGQHKRFPNRAHKRTALDVPRIHAQQEAEQTRFKEIEFWRLHQPFAHIGKEGFEQRHLVAGLEDGQPRPNR